MYQSMFGAGSGPSAFGYDMMVMNEIEKENESGYCSYDECGMKPCECQSLDCEDCEYYEED